MRQFLVLRKSICIFFFFFEIKSWPFYFDNGFTLRSSLFGDVKLTKNSDPDKYSYFSYGISFDVH